MSTAYLPHESKFELEPIEATLVEPPDAEAPGRSSIVLEQSTQCEPQRSAFETFVDSFFRRENIRWLAVTGAAIVVASSLMLVTREWANWPAIAKLLTILGYTALIYWFSDLGRKHLGLQITARVLQFLTLILLPICFLSLSWLFAPTAGMAGVAGWQMLLLIAPALGLAWFAASRIFEYLWRGKQLTFLASYLLLCIAGAMPRVDDAWLATLLTFILWLVATVGAIKINRHVFWLTEEYRLPRAFGFLPIVLLGLQFLTVVAIKTGLVLPIEWMGLGLVLMSSTVLMTSRAVADVYRQRTGGNMRPLPWNILLPLVIGLAMSLFGVTISFHGFSYGLQTTYAVVPSALLAGLMMFQATRETKQTAFVWIGLVLMMISYQCAPTLIAGLVQQLKASAAYAVGEERLPLAFYGLSYLPFVLAIAVSSSLLRRCQAPAFALPMRHFVTILSLALFALSWTQIKASFPVAVINLFLFAFLAVAFRDRRYAIPAIAALTVAVGTWIPFVNAMHWAEVPYFNIVTSLSMLAAGLTALPQLDRWINRLPQPSHKWHRELSDIHGHTILLCRTWSSMLSVALAPIWVLWVIANVALSQTLGHGGSETLASALQVIGFIPLVALLANFVLLTLRTRSLYFSLGGWSLVAFSGLATAVYLRVPGLDIATATTWLCALVSLALLIPLRRVAGGLGIEAYFDATEQTTSERQPLAMSEIILLPLQQVCLVLLVLVIAAIHIPSIVCCNLFTMHLPIPAATVAVFLWLVALKLCFQHRVAGIAAAITFPLLCSAIFITSSSGAVSCATLPLIWTVAGALTSLAACRSTTQASISIKNMAVAWILLSGGLSLSSFALEARLVAVIALTCLVIAELQRLKRLHWTVLAIAGNLQMLMLVAGLSGVPTWVTMVNPASVLLAALPALAVSLALSTAVWDIQRLRFDAHLRLAVKYSLRMFFVAAAVGCFLITAANTTLTFLVLLALTTSALVEMLEAVRKQQAVHLWSTFALVLVALLWLISQGQLVIGSGASQILLMGVAAAGLVVGRIIRNHRSVGFASQSLEQLGLVSPAVVVGMTLFGTVTGMTPILPGIDSAMLLAAAAIYFHRAIATSSRGYLIAAALVFNIASMHLWHTLSLNDLQLYVVPLGLTIIALVELLKREIPAAAQNTMRNIGALVILVSPVFEIVGGSWLHLITLLVLSVLVILMAIGLRLRTLVFMGTAFLSADLVAMVIRSAVANPGMLWIGGLGIGIAVIALAALCENQREHLLSKIRILSAELATWN